MSFYIKKKLTSKTKKMKQNKNKTKNKKIKEIYDFSSLELLNIHDLYKIFDKAKCKSKTYDATFQNNIIIKDYFISMRPGKEDQFYINHPLFLQNIRKGNSFIEFLGEESTKSERFICRKGFMKFFDLKLSYLKKSGYILTKDDFLIKTIILGQVETALREKKQVIVYKSSKENGANAQISYIEKCDSWLIASKNTSILIRNEKDIEDYDKSEFYFSRLISSEFMKILNLMSFEILQQFKKDLKGFTLIGEFLGDDKYTSRLLKYFKQQLRFITLIDLSSKDICVLPNIAFDFFKKYDLLSIQIEIITQTSSLDTLNYELAKIHNNISSSSIIQQGEGCVLYLVIRDPTKQSEDKVASLCKIKTLEYRLFRKIREKLKKINNNNKFPKNLLKVFIREAEILAKLCECEIDLLFYEAVAEEFFSQIVEHHNKENFKKAVSQFSYYIQKVVYNVRNKIRHNIFEEKHLVLFITPPNYIDESLAKIIEDKILNGEKIIKAYDKKFILSNEAKKILMVLEDITFDLEEISNFIKEIFFINFEDTILQRTIKNCPEITINDLNVLKERMLNKLQPIHSQIIFLNDILDDQILGPALIIETIQKSFFFFPNIEEKKPNKIIENKKKLIAFIPVGIPCMGKSSFSGVFQSFFTNEGYEFHTISSDLINKELIDEETKKNAGKKNLDFEEIKDKIAKKFKNLFILRFSTLIKTINASANLLHILFVDKNHPPNGFEKAVTLLKIDLKKTIDLKIIAIAPKIVNPLKIGHNEYPFSLNFLFTCLARSLARKDHETLKGNPIKVFDVILMFFNMYRGVKINKSILENIGFDYLIRLSYVREDETSEGKISDEIKKNIKECIQKKGNLSNLVKTIQEENLVLPEITKEEFLEEIQEEWKKFMNFLEEKQKIDDEKESLEESWDSCSEANDEEEEKN